MILVRIVAPMAENDIGADPILQGFEPELDLFALLRKETIPEVHHLDLAICGGREKITGRSLRFVPAFAGAAEDAPPHVETNALGQPVQKGPSGADFDIVGVGSEAEHREPVTGTGDPQRLHKFTAAGTLLMLLICHGMSPRSIISSRTCLSLSVSIARQNPSYR